MRSPSAGRAAALALRTKGHIHQQACRKCGHRNAAFRDDVAFDELARSAPATALVDAARSGTGRVADTFRDAHAHAAKSCDACHAPGACEVEVVLDHAAKVLVLSLVWSSTDHNGDDVAALKEAIVRLEDEIGALQAIDEQLRLQEERAAARGREHCSCFWQPRGLGSC